MTLIFEHDLEGINVNKHAKLLGQLLLSGHIHTYTAQSGPLNWSVTSAERQKSQNHYSGQCTIHSTSEYHARDTNSSNIHPL